MQLTGLVVNLGTALADLIGLAAMALVGRHEFDSAVAVPLVVPVDECDDPLTGLVLAGERRADSKSVPGSLARAVSMG